MSNKNKRKSGLKERADAAKNVLRDGKKQIKDILDPAARKKFLEIGLLILITVVVLAVYIACVEAWHFKEAFIVYMSIWVVTFLAYWFYNRGFSRKGVTPEMLPKEWSDEKKRQFIADGERRIKKSRWMIFIILPFCVVFIVELFMLYIWPTLYGFFAAANK